jgi:hypothetical protein
VQTEFQGQTSPQGSSTGTSPAYPEVDPSSLEIVKEFNRQQDKNRMFLREYAAFLTENASLSMNPYKSKVTRNKKFYRSRIDYENWFKHRQPKAKTREEKFTRIQKYESASKARDEVSSIIVTNSPPIAIKIMQEQAVLHNAQSRTTNLRASVKDS